MIDLIELIWLQFDIIISIFYSLSCILAILVWSQLCSWFDQYITWYGKYVAIVFERQLFEADGKIDELENYFLLFANKNVLFKISV